MSNPSYRPDWDDYFMTMAYMVAERSTCDRISAGAVLVRDNRVIATGYNGAPADMEHCDDVGHLMRENHCIRTLHGEENTLLQAAKLGIVTEDTTIYTTYSPCYHCAKKLIAAGIKRIVAGKIYHDEDVLDACKASDVKFIHHDPDAGWLDYLVDMYKDMPRERVDQAYVSKSDKK